MFTTDEIVTLRARAAAVSDGANAARDTGMLLTAREAARCLAGVVQFVSLQHGVAVMQRACANLAASDDAWRSRADGAVGEAQWTIAVVARGISDLCRPNALASALAFWASERDPAEWSRVAA